MFMIFVTVTLLTCAYGHFDENDSRIGGKFGNKQDIYDQEHLKSHLEGHIDTNKQMSVEEMRYYYFKLYDTNNDNHLDGLDFMKHMLHEMHEHGDKNLYISLDHLEITIDNIFLHFDANFDGYVDYAEFSKTEDVAK